jgi:(1->4)-alpha-D-glucan 1-alpha-D-glucosylmutase
MPPAIPRATYRVQLSADFGFDQVAAIVPYLQALGVSHLYASPFLKARPGSKHGYDTVDPSLLNPEFGGEDAFARLSDALERADMGLILDFVPNHMGVGYADNAWWLDVLEWGQKSPYASVFDIDWMTLPNRRAGGVLLPILGRPYGEALEQGEIELRYDAHEGSFSLWYFDHRLPVRPSRYSEIIKSVVSFAGAERKPAGRELLSVADKYSSPRAPTRSQAATMKAALAAIADTQIIAAGLRAYRPDVSDSLRVVALHRLLERQHYRVAHWRVALSEINYRRFFDINELAGIRVEDARTFRLVHRKVAALIAQGKLHGLRLDHIDGLYDPAQYGRRLQRLTSHMRKPDVSGPFYVVIEKILAPGEVMPRFAGVAGTTGYDALNCISRVLLDADGLPTLEQTWQIQAAPGRNFDEMVADAKARIINSTLSSEFTVLTRLLARIAAGHWPSRDYTEDRLRAALQAFITHFPVYRTYIAGNAVSAIDRATITGAIDAARADWYGADVAIFDFLEDALTLDLIAPHRSGYSRSRVKRFTAKVQQFTGPVMAKAVEDTVFYRHHRLLALNEVGNNPTLPGLSVEEFHQLMRERARASPHTMNATATHDTKRGEDARVRILALGELAQEWAQKVPHWSALNARHVDCSRRRSPSRAHEYMLYQGLIGAWPPAGIGGDFVARMQAYAVKAAREGKQETSWINPDSAYEAGLVGFVARILDRKQGSDFLAEFEAFAQRTNLLGALYGLSQLVLKATIPGVPDFYQGTELWDLALVDPDNRRGVAFDRRAQLLEQCDQNFAALAASWLDPGIKLLLTHRLLTLRSQMPVLFARGEYEPVATAGTHRDHVIAFARVWNGEAVVIAVGRHFARFTQGGRHWPRGADWDASLDIDNYGVAYDALNQTALNASLSVGELFKSVPVAVLRTASHGSSG